MLDFTDVDTGIKNKLSRSCFVENVAGPSNTVQLRCGQSLVTDVDDCMVPYRVIFTSRLTTASFINNITDFHQSDEPPQCHGGILADAMGLGKTLSIISLILATMFLNNPSGKSGPTLIILPPSCELDFAVNLMAHVRLTGASTRSVGRTTD